ncbi:MAG: polynucleotide adenylyltransferase PcnB [Gammaproteobacteria bacterium]|nr:polynucleotide adenylyltransferase PcnB [Gammaproteobacteria bacterium]
MKWFKTKKHRKINPADGVARDPIIIPRSEHGISRSNIDEPALKVLYRLHKAGYQACLVGGAVRDLMLGRHPKDFDVATDATPEEVSKLFRNCRLIGRRFRLAHIHFGRQIIEVATFRAPHGELHEEHHDESGRILRDNVYGEIHDDVWRRDFTANALYYNIADFSIIDYVGGAEDIANRRLRLIGDQETRYREDPVRMLRAIRFASKLDFSIDENCKQAILQLGPLLEEIPSARLFEEVLKLFHSGHAEESFHTLQKYGLLEYLFPDAIDALQDDTTAEFVRLAMQSTDDRVKLDKPVTPAFLFAALLWMPVKKQTEANIEAGMPAAVALQKAATKLISRQVRYVSIPKRFTTTMRDIWALQSRFRHHTGRRAYGVLNHPKFRAAYDFLCLRANAGEIEIDDCRWWTELQEKNPEQQKNILSAQKHPPRKRRSRPGRDRGGKL